MVKTSKPVAPVIAPFARTLFSVFAFYNFLKVMKMIMFYGKVKHKTRKQREKTAIKLLCCLYKY